MNTIHQWKMHGYASHQWNFELHTDGYYKIKSMHSGLYLSVENNSSEQNAAVVQKAFNNGSGQLWKVELLSDGAYKITPKSGESSNRVLASAYYSSVGDGIAVQQRLFVDDTNYKDEWILIGRKLEIVNYYDSTIANTPTQSYIEEAVEFMSEAYRRFNIVISNKSVSRYNNAIADQCSLGANVPCESGCGEHANHHKNTYRMAKQLYDDNRKDNHVYVMWADRAYDSYCHGDQHTEFNAIAVVYNSWPVINFLTLDPNEANDAQKRKAKMSIVLTHEMAHVLGLPDVYDDEAHTGVECVMNTYSTESGVSFYKRIMDGKADYFCQSCTEKLNILTAKVLMEGNE